MATNEQLRASSGGVGFFGLLAILFIGLKLGHVIDWEWWLVLSPIWGPFAMALAVMIALSAILVVGAGLVIGLLALGEWIFDDGKKKKKKPGAWFDPWHPRNRRKP